jgi:hypothetical protein
MIQVSGSCYNFLWYGVVYSVCEPTFTREVSLPDAYPHSTSWLLTCRVWFWKCGWYVPPKLRFTYGIHGARAQKLGKLISTFVTIWHPTNNYFVSNISPWILWISRYITDGISVWPNNLNTCWTVMLYFYWKFLYNFFQKTRLLVCPFPYQWHNIGPHFAGHIKIIVPCSKNLEQFKFSPTLTCNTVHFTWAHM